MITLHHLNNSRSQRILWLLEELGVDYEVRTYERDAETNLAPPGLKDVHPLGKSPVISDGEHRVFESGAIVEFLIQRYGNGRLAPASGTPDYVAYLQWLHYAEGSAMLPLMLRLYTSRLGEAAAPLTPRIESEIANHFSFVDETLRNRTWFVGEELTGADIMMSFPLEAMKATGAIGPFPAAAAFVDRIQARDAYQRALERGPAYAYGPRPPSA